MKVLQQSLGRTQSKDVKTRPSHLMNFQWSREQKWTGFAYKHSVYTHFPKDPNCGICLKTKITRASCRRRAGTVEPRAENFGDLITADHKILSEGSESRNNHRYWQLSGYNPTCVKQKLLRKRTRTYKGPVRKTQWRSRTSSRKFW